MGPSRKPNKPRDNWIFFKAGSVERGRTRRRYPAWWRITDEESGGKIEHPPMRKGEARAYAKRYGAKALFFETERLAREWRYLNGRA